MKRYWWLILMLVVGLAVMVGNTGCEDDDNHDDTTIVVTNTASASVQPLDAPVLLSPADGASGSSGNSVFFDWADVNGAEQYELHVDNQVQVVNGSKANYQVYGGNQTHTWWVIAVSSTRGKSPSSPTRQYTTAL